MVHDLDLSFFSELLSSVVDYKKLFPFTAQNTIVVTTSPIDARVGERTTLFGFKIPSPNIRPVLFAH